MTDWRVIQLCPEWHVALCPLIFFSMNISACNPFQALKSPIDALKYKVGSFCFIHVKATASIQNVFEDYKRFLNIANIKVTFNSWVITWITLSTILRFLERVKGLPLYNRGGKSLDCTIKPDGHLFPHSMRSQPH